MPDPHRPRRRHIGRPRVATAALLMALAGCSEGDVSKPTRLPDGSASPSPSAAATPPAAPDRATRASVRTVTGTMTPEAREKLKVKITAAVDTWFDAAYVGGDYPRTDFDDAFASFTPGAQVRARKDMRLMSNADIGGSVDTVQVLARRIKIDALAVDGRASAVTVDFRLGLALTGELARRERVAGDLYLTFTAGGWRVFGYAVSRGTI